MAFDGGLSARQLVAGAVQLLFVAIAESVNGVAVDWLMRTLNCGRKLGTSDKKMKERDRTS